ncbi:MAG TPA: hypothetical protein VGZ22_01695 [Isosphaeraceae bacterium]|jgi:hypothetical protein|nr:hypothetical protein [Isosphaeraceae bacterium]
MADRFRDIYTELDYSAHLAYSIVSQAIATIPTMRIVNDDPVRGVVNLEGGWPYVVDVTQIDANRTRVTVSGSGKFRPRMFREQGSLLRAVESWFVAVRTYPAAAAFKADLPNWTGWDPVDTGAGIGKQLAIRWTRRVPGSLDDEAVAPLPAELILEQVKRLTELQEHGHISRTEADAKKQDLLSRL